MPGRSSSFVRHDAVPEERVVAAARAWAEQLRASHPEVVRVGYLGSYARGDYVPGSDLDIVIEVSVSDLAYRDRPPAYRPENFPVPTDVFVYTTDELARLRRDGTAFIKTIDAEVRWLIGC